MFLGSQGPRLESIQNQQMLSAKPETKIKIETFSGDYTKWTTVQQQMPDISNALPNKYGNG